MAKPSTPEIVQSERISPDIIRVGKDVIELLTIGMYVSPLTIFREYVQNAADAIDDAAKTGLLKSTGEGRVTIDLDHGSRSLTIRDNGAGIPRKKAGDILLAIGASPKRGSDARGFRGVGRLCGLAYCRELEFRTKAKGDATVVSLTWDSRGLRSRLADALYKGDVRQILAETVSMREDKAEDRNEHFFEVRMRDVSRFRQDLLLNEKLIATYLAQVSPVPFDDAFTHRAVIEERLAAFGARPPVELIVASVPVRKLYRDVTPIPGKPEGIEIEAIEFVEFVDVDAKVGAIAWIGHHQYVRSMPIGLGIRGLRARIGDVQVGEANLFDDSFKEPRFNGWSMGEIHVLDRRVVPNARRDNFEVNHHYYNLLAQLGPLAGRIAHTCRTRSVSRTAVQIIQNMIADADAKLDSKRRIERAELSRIKGALVRTRLKLKSVDDEAERRRFSKHLDRLEKRVAAQKVGRGAPAVAIDEALALISKHVSNRAQAEKLANAIKQLCS